jgi:tape measure domain-containing protein
MNVAGSELDWIAAIDGSQFHAELRAMRSDLNNFTSSMQTQGAQIESFANKATAAAAGFFSTQAAFGFVKSMVDVRGEFQKIEIAFNTMLGSKEKADQLMAEAVKLAAITPFTLQDVASGAKQLLAYGFAANDITKDLTMLGNVAAGVGSQLGDLTYLYGTLRASGRVTQVDINQFAGRGIPIYEELAKVLNITTAEVRNYVSAGKIGFPQVEKAFQNMTGQGGKFFNLMQEQSKSLTGQLSNLEDAWDRMLNALGKSQEGIIGDGIQAAISLVDNYQKVIEVIELLVITYGSYRAALLLTTTVTGGMSAVELVHYNILVMKDKLMGILTSKQAALAVSTAAYTAVLAGLVAVGYSLIQYQNAAEIAEESLTEAKNKGARAVENETEKIDGLIKTIKDHNTSKREQKQAYDELLLTTKGALDHYSQEEIAAGKGATAINQYKESVRKATEAEQEFADYKGLQDQIDKINEKGIEAITTFDRLAISFSGFFKAMKEIAKGNLSGAISEISNTFDSRLAQTKVSDLKSAQSKILSSNPEVQKLVDAQKAAKAAAEEQKAKELQAQKTAEQLAKEAAAAKKYNVLLEKRKDLEREISQDLAGARASGLDDEAQQIAAINKKYDDRIAAIDKLNAKLNASDQMSKTPVESARNIELGVAGVDAIINGKNGYKDELDRKKKLYEEYEQAKIDLGEKLADEMYKNEILDYKSFADYISKDIESRKGKTDLLSTKKNEVAAPIKVEEDKNQRLQFQKLLVDTQTFEQSRNLIIEKAIKDAADLRAKGYNLQAEQAIANGKEELERFDQNTIQQIAGYKKLFDGFTRMSTDAITEYIQKAKQKANADLAAGLLTRKAYDLVIKAINNAKASLNDAIPSQLRGFAQIFKDLASSSNGLSSGLTNVLNILGDMVSAAADVKQGVADTMDALKSYKETKAEAGGGLLGTLTAGLSVAGPAGKAIGAVVNVVKGITSFFKAAKESARQAAAELQAYQDNMVKGELAYNQLLRERERTLKSIGDLSLSELRNRQAILNTQESQAQQDYDRLLAMIKSTGQQITGEHTEEYGGFLGFGKKSRVVQDLAGVAGSDFKSLEKLYNENKLTDSTKAWFEELQKIKSEMDDIGQSAQDAFDEIDQRVTGTTAASITDAIISGFKNGKRFASDFADDFKGMMQDSFLSLFRDNYLNAAISDFYKRFASLSGDSNGLTDDDVEVLRDAYNAAIQNGLDKLADLDKITGGSSASQSEKGGIQAEIANKITQDQASELTGLFRAQYDITKQISLTALDHLKIATIGIHSLEMIEQHTFNTVAELKASNANLEKIITNTKPLPQAQSSASLTGSR